MDYFAKGFFSKCFLIVDCTDCKVERPSSKDVQKAFYSGKKKTHTIKYEVGVSLRTGELKWIFGGMPGSVHDIKVLRKSKLTEKLLAHELIVGDSAYQGERKVIVPFKRY